MRKVILPFVALIVCVASVTAIRAISATISSPMAVSQPGNIYSCSLIQAGDYILRAANQAGTLTFAERVKYQRAIEDVYWRHRLWPKENATPKPTLNQVMSQAQIENKV